MPHRRHDDNITVEDILKDNPNNKVLLAKILIQTRKTNGQVLENKLDIECLQLEMKEKIGWKVFAIISGILGCIIVLFNVLNMIGA